MQPSVLVLDAMGVIFRAADDVAELLVPFVREHVKPNDVDADDVARYYHRASLGEMDAASFWVACGLSPKLEDSYLARHCVMEDLSWLLDKLRPSMPVWCLSNDVSEWSRKLRARHGLEQEFAGFVISGDVGARKPDENIYLELISQVGRPANAMLFVDDRPKNLDAAQSLGFQTVCFCPGPVQPKTRHQIVQTFRELELVIRG